MDLLTFKMNSMNTFIKCVMTRIVVVSRNSGSKIDQGVYLYD
jgi:hypothetical protein